MPDSGLRRGTRLALDWGQARIGVAACDASATLAYPVETIAQGPGALARIRALVAEYEPIELIVGLPRHLAGGEGASAALVRQQIRDVAEAVMPLPTRLVDERLTTVTAAQRLREVGRDARRQRAIIDQAAAVAILEYALACERGTSVPAGELVRKDAH